MNPEIGRFLEGRTLETQKLIRMLMDLAEGLGRVETEVQGRELVFRLGAGDRGFLRLTPAETSVRLGFPRGSELFDPKDKLQGAPGFQLGLTVRDQADVDGYVRRLIEDAHRVDG